MAQSRVQAGSHPFAVSAILRSAPARAASRSCRALTATCRPAPPRAAPRNPSARPPPPPGRPSPAAALPAPADAVDLYGRPCNLDAPPFLLAERLGESCWKDVRAHTAGTSRRREFGCTAGARAHRSYLAPGSLPSTAEWRKNLPARSAVPPSLPPSIPSSLLPRPPARPLCAAAMPPESPAAAFWPTGPLRRPPSAPSGRPALQPLIAWRDRRCRAQAVGSAGHMLLVTTRRSGTVPTPRLCPNSADACP